MYRVITQYRNGTSRPVIERGPWHDSRETAENWAEILSQMGYQTSLESQRGPISSSANDQHALADALASMA